MASFKSITNIKSDWTAAQRRMQLHRLLSAGGPVIAKALSEQWHCSEKTIRRDLQNMRDVDGLPIEQDRSSGTWRYTRPVDEVPAMLLKSEDRRAMLFSLQATAQLEGTPVCDQVQLIYEQLLATLPPESATDFKNMMKSVRFVGPSIKPVSKAIWDVVLLCLEARESMQIEYVDGLYESKTNRKVDPYGLIMRDRRWNLVAYCHYYKMILTFSLNRIISAVATDDSFKKPALSMDQFMADHFDGYQTTGEKLDFVLRIAADAPPYVRDRIWSENEKRKVDDAGTLIVKFTTAAAFAVEREVLANCPLVEIVEPESIRASVRGKVEQLAKMLR